MKCRAGIDIGGGVIRGWANPWRSSGLQVREQRWSEIGTAWIYPGLGKFFGSCRRTEVLEMTGLECSPPTLHGTDRVVKKGLRQLITTTIC